MLSSSRHLESIRRVSSETGQIEATSHLFPLLFIASEVFLCICNGTHFSRGQEALVYISNETVPKNQSECIILTSAFKAYFCADLQSEAVG